jgi:DNA-directed RNA polymerase I subunit RPA2
MGKQTMGTPTHAFKTRTDNKMFRINTPQTPIAQTVNHRRYAVDQYAQGTNAVIAVLSYTGFDMEDAMCINKSAFERGFGYGIIYKAEEIDLSEKGAPSEGKLCYFSNTSDVRAPSLSAGSYSTRY